MFSMHSDASSHRSRFILELNLFNIFDFILYCSLTHKNCHSAVSCDFSIIWGFFPLCSHLRIFFVYQMKTTVRYLLTRTLRLKCYADSNAINISQPISHRQLLFNAICIKYSTIQITSHTQCGKLTQCCILVTSLVCCNQIFDVI